MTDTAQPALCPVCQTPIGPEEERVACADCATRYHAECWALNQGCAVYGCAQVPPTEKWSELEIPAGHWGQEHKPCPACGGQILAAALRCRHCGATFASADPQQLQDFRRQQAQAAALPRWRRCAVALFVCNIVPGLAPFAALAGLAWQLSRPREVAALPPLHRTLARLGIAIGCTQTALLLLMGALYAMKP